MKIAITGAGGFIGRILVQELRIWGNILPVTRDVLDLTDRDAVDRWFSENKPNIVIHCAVNGDHDMDTFNRHAFGANMMMFDNIYNNREHYDRFINLGSGAEFDRRFRIKANEEDLFDRYPQDHYGMSKNLISRICYRTPEFYTLRLFGLQHPDHALWKRIWNPRQGDVVDLDTRLFDWFHWQDLVTVVNYYIGKNQPLHKDINLAYRNKTDILNLAMRSAREKKVGTSHLRSKSYIAAMEYISFSTRINELGLPPFRGLE